MAFSQTGLVLKLTVIEAGALAALISAIDPVSTLTLFKLLKVHPDLHNILFGESVLNDAVSIIIFRSIQRFFKAKFRPVRRARTARLSARALVWRRPAAALARSAVAGCRGHSLRRH